MKKLIYFLMILSISCSHKNVSEADREPAADQRKNTREGRAPEGQDEIAKKCALDEKYPKMVNEIYLKHKSMLINYNPKQRAPNWIYHELYRENVERACYKRPGPGSGPFTQDAQLLNLLRGFNIENDLSILDGGSYKNTGFDRGHMAPNSDFAFDPESQIQSFFMSNMVPQQPDVNQKVWEKLERRLRNMACGMGHVRVYTGPIYENPNVIDRLQSCAAIPTAYYKVILAIKNGEYYGIGFVFSQNDRPGQNLNREESNSDISDKRIRSIYEIEQMTGQKFFTEFAKDIQEKFKSQNTLTGWTIPSDNESCFKTKCDEFFGKKKQQNNNLDPNEDAGGE